MSLNLESLRTHYPFQSHFLELGQLKLHYLDEGEGPPLVMLHGNPSWSFLYRDWVRALRDRYRVVVPDHIGCGPSSKPDDSQYEFTLRRRVDDLEALLDHLGIGEGISLLAHDWGGVIGTSFAVRHPERISRLVLFNTAGFLLPAGSRLHWTIRFCKYSRLAAFLIRRFNAFAAIASFVGCRMRPLSRELRRAYTAPYDNWHNRLAILRFIQDIPLREGEPAYAYLRETQEGLARLREKPMLICWGEQDFVFDGAFLSEWLRRFPAAEVHRFPRGGHYILEDAFPEVYPRVDEFLQRPD